MGNRTPANPRVRGGRGLRFFNRASHPKHHGFTLVEVLVVITVITMLLGLLLPVLKKALNSAHTVACINNLKQIGIAESMYAGDFGGHDTHRWAPYSYGVEWNRNTWWHRILRGKYGGEAYLPKPKNWHTSKASGMVTICPAKSAPDWYGYLPGSYCINGCGHNPAAVFLGSVDVRRKRHPYKSIWFVCTGRLGMTTGPFSWGYSNCGELTHHGTKGSNLLYFDQHVKWADAFALETTLYSHWTYVYK